MLIELNEGQRKCLLQLMLWWKHDTEEKQVFEIAGAAGTGKTTIIRQLIESLDDLEMADVIFVTFVGKAALNLSKAGLPGRTIHSTIYHVVEIDKLDANGNPIIEEGRRVKTIRFIKKEELPGVKLIVIDEASMVDKIVAADLLSYNIPIIAIGDLNQLPPVFGKPVFLKHPDAILTEVVRQKADSPILSLSQYIINSKHIKLYPGVYDNKLMIVKKEDFFKRFLPVLLKSDIVICGKNSTRDKLNEMIRDMYFKSIGIDTPLPEMMVGDKLICRKNNWILEKNGINLINGLIGRVTDIDMESSTKNVVPIDFKPDFIDAEFEDVPINMKYFKGDATTKTLIKNTPHVGELFELGYAITCHLSQGSQYEKVIVFCERMGDNDYYKKWLYTAVTRASEKLILII